MKPILKHKFHAKPTDYDGGKYDSKKEAQYAQKLNLAKQSGELLFYLRQTRMDLPGNTVYRCDFVEFWKDGEVKFTEVKGYSTPEWIMKKKIVEDLYPIQIQVI